MSISPDLAQWRKTQRAELISRRQAITPDDHHAWSATITQLVEQGFPILQKLVVGFCWPYKGEMDPRFAIRFLRERGARAALPAVVKKNAPLEFREWWPGVTMTPGVFDLPVPDDTKVLIPDALLIPPVGFGEQGDRLGYGGGFFDRTLEAITPQPLKIAMAFEVSRIPTTYPQAHDILMDFVVTERGIHLVENGKMRIIDVSESIALSNQMASDRKLPRMQESM